MSWWERIFGARKPSMAEQVFAHSNEILEQNRLLVKRIMSDSEAKTALLDRIIAAKFDRPVVGGAPAEQPESAVGGLMGLSFADDDDRQFLEAAEEVRP